MSQKTSRDVFNPITMGGGVPPPWGFLNNFKTFFQLHSCEQILLKSFFFDAKSRVEPGGQSNGRSMLKNNSEMINNFFINVKNKNIRA